MGKSYDRAYFDRWYREPGRAVADAGELRRKVAMVVAAAEYYLGRRVRTVLDVGCGEGRWRAPLRKLRPDIHYRGIDASAYVVRRYGSTRNIGLARFAQLESLRFDARFDLILCSNVLHYLRPNEIRRGLSGFDELLGGVAFIEVYTRHDAVEGDEDAYVARSVSWYRRQFAEARLTAVGASMYVGSALAGRLLALERPGSG